MILEPGLRIESGLLISPGPLELYSFTTFTFTNAAITGRTGPSLANCLASYNTAANPWLNNTAFFNVVTTGYQLWTVPATGSYQITALGASGGLGHTNYGFSAFHAGARMIGTFSFTSGQKINIIVGQAGTSVNSGCGLATGGGGGGSFVFSEDQLTPYIIAGGGGGGSAATFTETNSQPNSYASITNTGQRGYPGNVSNAGTSGFGGGQGNIGCVASSSGGAGFFGSGTQGSDGNSGVGERINGSTGARGGTGVNGVNGGFGGGAGASSYNGGGGGGYSGGGGGGINSCTCDQLGAGGGGGSFNSGTNQTNTLGQQLNGPGQVIITRLS